MKRIEIRGFGIARLIAITVLLLAPFSASADSSLSSASAASSYGVWAAHHVNIASDALERHNSPAEEPPHCHMRSPHPLEIGPEPSTVKDDLPVPALHGISAPRTGYRDATAHHIGARIPIPQSRFILFGNFRS